MTGSRKACLKAQKPIKIAACTQVKWRLTLSSRTRPRCKRCVLVQEVPERPPPEVVMSMGPETLEAIQASILSWVPGLVPLARCWNGLAHQLSQAKSFEMHGKISCKEKLSL